MPKQKEDQARIEAICLAGFLESKERQAYIFRKCPPTIEDAERVGRGLSRALTIVSQYPGYAVRVAFYSMAEILMASELLLNDGKINQDGLPFVTLYGLEVDKEKSSDMQIEFTNGSVIILNRKKPGE